MAAVPEGDDGLPPTTTVQGSAPGWSGFGILGSAIALSAPAAAGPLGLWGAANSVFFNLVRKADELVFPKNTLLEIRLGRTPDESGSSPIKPVQPARLEVGGEREPRVLLAR